MPKPAEATLLRVASAAAADDKPPRKRRRRSGLRWALLLACGLYVALIGALLSGVIGQLLPNLERWLRAEETVYQHAQPTFRIGVGVAVVVVSLGLLALTAVAWMTMRVPTGEVPPAIDTPRLPLTLARDLSTERFRMGDPRAATFPYDPDFVEAGYDLAVATLNAIAQDHPRIKRGLIIVGESNVGKTRLAYEAARRCLPEWHALVWRHGATIDDLPLEQMRGCDLVVFVDDLHEYVPQQQEDHADEVALAVAANPETTALAAMLDLVREPGHARRVAIIATCRGAPYEQNVRSSQLRGLFTELEVARLNALPTNTANPLVAKLLRDLAAHGEIEEEFFDGTVGSLLLRLNEKHNQFLQLGDSPEAWLLRSMKLLYRAGSFRQTERRVAAVAAGVYGETALRDNAAVWRQARDTIVQLGFVSLEFMREELTLVIRKDVYFDWVITDTVPDITQGTTDQQAEVKADPGLIADLLKLIDTLAGIRDARGLASTGLALDRLNQSELSLVACNQAIAIDPMLTAAWSTKGVALSKLKRYEEAVAVFEQELAIDPTFAHDWVSLGVALDQLGRYEESLDAFDRALALDAKYFFTWYFKGMSLAELQRYEEALGAFDHALALDPTYASAYYRKGNALAGARRLSEAVEAYKQALERNPQFVAAWTNMGLALGFLDRHEEELDAFQQALALDGSNASAWTGKGNALQSLNRVTEALDSYEQALSLDPTLVSAWIGKGAALGRLSRHEEALNAFNRALEIDPSRTLAMTNKGVALGLLGRYAEALDTLDHALALDATLVSAWRQKATALRALGRDDEAREAERRADELEGK